jgi:chromatin assembly factor 1 subunit A
LRAIVLGGGSSAAASNRNRKSGPSSKRAGNASDEESNSCIRGGDDDAIADRFPSGTVNDIHGGDNAEALTPKTEVPKRALLERFDRQSNDASPSASSSTTMPSSSKENRGNSALSNTADPTAAPAWASPSLESTSHVTVEKDGAASPSVPNAAEDATQDDALSVEINVPTSPEAKAAEKSSPTTSATKATSTNPKQAPRRRIVPTTVAVLSAAEATTPPPADNETNPPADDQPSRAAASPPPSGDKNSQLRALVAKYAPRAQELLQQCREAERVPIPVPDLDEAAVEDGIAEEFPGAAVPVVAALAEGSPDTLSTLARQVLEQVNPRFPDVTEEVVSSKLKVLATRKGYGKKPRAASSSSALNVFEDEDPDHVWRWELTVLELLPKESVPAAKKARTAIRRLSSYWQAVSKLLAVVDTSLASGSVEILDEDALAKIATLEEKVLKFEREDEKLRLSAQSKAASKRLQDEERQRKAEEAHRKKEEEQEKKREAARLKQQKQDEAARQKEAFKREKQEKAELQAKEAELKAKEEQEKLHRQQSSFRSFFSRARVSVSVPAAKPKPATSKRLSAPEGMAVAVDVPEQDGEVEVHVDPRGAAQPTVAFKADGFDSNGFRALINSSTCLEPPFQRQRRRRRSRRVPVLVTVTVFPDDEAEFGALPYAEQQQVWINNRYRFFLFHEDVRPPYHGTWSKGSGTVNGRRPLGKESSLDYDNDSEAEWEEEEEVGEDLDNDDGEDEEEELGEQYEKDGWLDDDELRKDASSELTVCLVAPVNGVPLVELPARTDYSTYIEGLDIENGLCLLRSHHTIVLSDSPDCVDVFPPDERDVEGSNAETDTRKDLADDDLKAVCRFVHHSTHGSRDKLVDELRSKFESITHSRAQILRTLESIAEKKKHSSGAYYWEVKVEVIEKLELQDLRDAELAVSSPGLDVEKTKRVASFIHHKTLKSKEKLVEEVRAQCDVATKSEAQRLLEYVAEKKTDNGFVYWAIKPEAQRELGLEYLPSSPPVSQNDTNQLTDSGSNARAAAEPKKRKSTEVAPSQGGEAKSKRRLSLQPVDASSAMMLSMFLKKK